MIVRGAGRRILAEVMSWSGVTSAEHRHGGIEVRLGTRKLGHLRGDVLADVSFGRDQARELIAAGCAREHSWEPGSGWVSHSIREERDERAVIGLLRLAYERAVAALDQRAGVPA